MLQCGELVRPLSGNRSDGHVNVANRAGEGTHLRTYGASRRPRASYLPVAVAAVGGNCRAPLNIQRESNSPWTINGRPKSACSSAPEQP
jgi:hypothetical protein